MRKNLSTIGMALLLSGGVIFADTAANATLVTLSGHVPTAVSQLTAEGSLPETNRLSLAIGLPLTNTGALSNLLQQVYDPSSTNYHKYLTPDQFTARFGPTAQDYQSVIDFATRNGLVVSGTYSNRLLVDVTGKVSDIQKAFHVAFHTYRHPTESRDFYAPDTEPTVDSSLPILHISGLDNYYVPHPNLKMRTLAQKAGAAPGTGSGPGGAYEGKDFRSAYVPGTTLTGKGQNIALLQFDGYYPSDIAAYATQIGLTNVPQLVVVPIDGGVPTPTSFGNPEVSLDIEMVLSMAPGVSNIYVYEAPNPSPWEDILNRMVSDNLAKQISSSWGGGGPDPVAEQIFQQMALQGQSYYNASGDYDAYTGAIPFPSDSPYITVVGGTTLTTGQTASYTSETVWNWGIEFGDDGVGSSGGISPTYSIPSWQTNINMPVRGGSQTMRNIPDVALTGDNVWVIYGGGQTGAFGGTSCASPLWGSFTALINEQARNDGHAPVGFINPALYAIAAGANYANCFHDITTENNTWSGSPNLFYATNGYDLCTGLGSPNGTNLINALISSSATNVITHLSAPAPPYGTKLTALNGGNPNGNWELFVQDDTALNSGVISNGWWLTLTSANPVGAAADVGVAMTASASSIPLDGEVTYTITVTNYGPSALSTNVVVTDTLPSSSPPDFKVVSYSSTLGSVDQNGFNLIWNVGTLTNIDAGAQLTLTLQAINSLGTLLNSASVSSDTPDPNPDDGTASTSVAVVSSTPPQLSASVSGTPGSFQFTITGQSGQEYIIQASTNLVNWVDVYTNPDYTAPFNFVDPNATNYTSRFYRVVTGP
jgi:uncharacterized repeat protein (TIGR01451 family)